MADIKTFSEFQKELQNNPSLQQAFKDDPIKASQQVQSSSTIPNTFIYQIVVGTLGISVVLVIISLVVLSAIATKEFGINQSVLTILTAISSGAIGALAGLLTPTSRPQQ